MTQPIDPNTLTEPEIRQIYETPGYTMAFEITRKRKETGLTFSHEALTSYCETIGSYVATRVMRYWNEHGEPPVKMNTLVTVAIDHAPVEHPDSHDTELVDEALRVARGLLTMYEATKFMNPEHKASHAQVCRDMDQKISDLERARQAQIESL